MVESIKTSEADELKEFEISVKGVTDLETAIKLLSGKSDIPEGFDLKTIKHDKTKDGIKLYPPICCWRTGGRIVWGVAWFGYCEYRGEGCPA